MPGQDKPDELRPPAGVLLAEGQRLEDQGRRKEGRRGGRPVSGGGGLAAVLPPEAEQVIDGAEGEAEGPRQRGRGRAASMGIEQRAADGESNGTWHGANLQRHYGQPERGEKVLVYL